MAQAVVAEHKRKVADQEYLISEPIERFYINKGWIAAGEDELSIYGNDTSGDWIIRIKDGSEVCRYSMRFVSQIIWA